MEIGKKIKQSSTVILAVFVMIIFVNYASSWLYRVSSGLYPMYKGIDPDNAFLYYDLHHIFQGIIFFIMISIACKLLHLKLVDFGFNLKQAKFSIIYSVCFIAAWAIIQFGIGYLTVRGGAIYNMGFPVNIRNIVGYFLFEVLLSGSSEELFFRAFVITVLLTIMKNYVKEQRSLFIVVIFLSAIIFMSGHIGFKLFPFRITYINPLQQLTVVIFSIAYAIPYLRTKSLLAPVLMHNLLNGVITASMLFYYYMTN